MFKHKGSILALSCAISLAYGVNLVSAEKSNSSKHEAAAARKEKEIKVSNVAKIVGISSLTLGGSAGIYALGEILKNVFLKRVSKIITT